MLDGKHVWQQEEEIKEDSSTVPMIQEQLFISELFKDIQDAILLIFHYRTMLFFRATSSSTFTMSDVLSICILLEVKVRAKDRQYSSRKDPKVIDLNVPHHAQYLQNAWKRHQDAENWVNINLAIKKGLTLYQTRSNAIILQETLPAYCIPKVVRMKNGEV